MLTAPAFLQQQALRKSIDDEIQAAIDGRLIEGRCGELAHHGLWKLDPGARLHDHGGGKVHLGLQRSHLPATQLDLQKPAQKFHVYSKSAWPNVLASCLEMTCQCPSPRTMQQTLGSNGSDMSATSQPPTAHPQSCCQEVDPICQSTKPLSCSL